MGVQRGFAVRGMRLLLAVGLCAALTSRNYGQESPPGGPLEPAVVKPPETWVDPESTGELPGDVPGSGLGGWLADGLPHYRSRYAGLGKPLKNTSWLNRPIYAGGFIGETFGDTLAPDALELEPSLYTGFWLGYDVSHYWGCDIRLGLNYGDVTYLPEGDGHASSRNAMADFSMLYYPWGDSRWRPYGALGLGIGSVHFTDPSGESIDHTGLALPLGFGVKYLCGNRWALRLDIRDNVTFGGHGLNTINNWSVIGGFEYHWGSVTSAQYYPW
ncbi:MAG: outer membrane beta-barrel protein [Pirellulaceae bacterium]